MDAVEVEADPERFPAVDRRPDRPTTIADRRSGPTVDPAVRDVHRRCVEIERRPMCGDRPPRSTRRCRPAGRPGRGRRASGRTPSATSRPTSRRQSGRRRSSTSSSGDAVRADAAARSLLRPIRRPMASTTFIDGVPTNWATNRLHGWSYTSIGTPHCSIGRARITANRSPIAIASSWSWVTYSVVTPRRRCSRVMTSRVWVAQLRVEVRHGLVHQEQPWVAHDRPTHRRRVDVGRPESCARLDGRARR